MRHRLLPSAILLAITLAALHGLPPTFGQDAGQRPMLGVQLEADTEPPTISVVIEGSTAATMGLKPGDVILAANGKPVRTTAELVAAIRGAKVGDRLDLRVKRGDAELDLSGRLAAAPPPPTVVGKPAPALDCQRWANLPEGAQPPTIESLRGKVVLMHCFQSW